MADAEVPTHRVLTVECGSEDVCTGQMLLPKFTVICRCATCAEKPESEMKPRDFERHAGMGHLRKWRQSIRVVDAKRRTHRGKYLGVGEWLKAEAEASTPYCESMAQTRAESPDPPESHKMRKEVLRR